MQKLFVKKEYIKTDLKNPMDDIVSNVLRDIHPDLKIAMMAGCQIDTNIVEEKDGMKIIIKTRYPISILKDEKGNVYDVREKRS